MSLGYKQMQSLTCTDQAGDQDVKAGATETYNKQLPRGRQATALTKIKCVNSYFEELTNSNWNLFGEMTSPCVFKTWGFFISKWEMTIAKNSLVILHYP